MKQLYDITYRHIAIMLAKALPIEGAAFQNRVEANLAEIKKLPQTAKVALKSAYIFSQKVPREERQDLFQDIALAVLKARTSEERLAYAIARCDWKDWWKKYKTRQNYSLDSVIDNSEGDPATLGELIIGESEFELKMNGKLDAQRIWNRLPANIKSIVQKRLLSQPLLGAERVTLHRWVKNTGYQLLLQS